MTPPASTATKVSVGGRELSLSNLDKVLYPQAGFTKGEVIGYYQAIAPALLPHLTGRPLTLKRYPNGVEGQFFYEKRCPSHRPPWMPTASVWSDRNKGEVNYCVVDELAALVWVANTASLELHPSLSRAVDIKRPTMVVFDLDPGAPATIVECCSIGLRLRELFSQMGLESFAKTSGSKGLQLYVPLNTPVGYDGSPGTKGFALAVAQLFEKRFPGEVVSSMKKDLRPGKVLIDWSQNDEHKTTVSVYSLRARPRPSVSAPVTWDEVAGCAEGQDPDRLVFEAGEVVERVERVGDLFAPLNELEQALPALAST
ncbi:MAG TPA: non-homologous end-joining DNA ligase [Acidimicrobiales bacterium]|nr:non-homologous end-joining DNA ligase [Acidimicrobiales bacterium]